MWDRLLLVAGTCNDSIQYPLGLYLLLWLLLLLLLDLLALTFDPRFPVEEQCVLVGELDGVRVINSKSQELLQEVPLVCQDIFKIASMAPGALLLEAHREYEVGTASTFDPTSV